MYLQKELKPIQYHFIDFFLFFAQKAILICFARKNIQILSWTIFSSFNITVVLILETKVIFAFAISEMKDKNQKLLTT